MRVQRFAQEASSCMRIQHLNVIKILDSATTPDGFTYLVMELLEGHPLSEEIRRGYPLSLQRSLEIILPVCDVLLAAHNVGVLHRDIKPSTVSFAERCWWVSTLQSAAGRERRRYLVYHRRRFRTTMWSHTVRDREVT